MEIALVTGASGFLGKHVVDALSDQYIVHAVSRQPTAYYSVDISKQAPVINEPYKLVVHAAGKAHEFGKIQDTAAYYEVNVDGTRRVCDAFDRTGHYPDKFLAFWK